MCQHHKDLKCASRVQNEKKRKRAAKTDAQIAALNALFDADPYPSTAAKKEFAASMGLELVEVNNWLENRRRKARAAGVLGRPRLVHVSELEDEVLGDDHHPVIVIEAPPLEELIEDAQREIAAKKLAKQASEDACALDAAAAPVAAGPAPNAATDEAHAPMATDEAPAAAQPETTAAAAPKAPKAAPPSLPSPDERAKLAESLANEASLLRTHGLAGPLTDLAAATPAPYSDAHLAALIAGQSLPLSALVTALFPLLTAPEGSAAALTAEGLRSRIVDLATRKSHDPADNPKGALLQDALEAGPPPPAPSMWQWELRDVKTLPKAQRSAATQIRKRATSVAQRLAAVVAAHQALTAFEMGTCTEAKAAKAVDALAKHKSYEQLEADAAAELAAAQAKQQAAATKGAVSSEEKQRAAAAKEAEKERLRLEKEAAKELARKAKEEEKAKAAAEKEAEKERKQQEREAERERKQKEAEAAKLIKKTGFKDAEKLNKTANKFMVSGAFFC